MSIPFKSEIHCGYWRSGSSREVGEGTATPEVTEVADNSHIPLLEAQRVLNTMPNTTQSEYLLMQW